MLHSSMIRRTTLRFSFTNTPTGTTNGGRREMISAAVFRCTGRVPRPSPLVPSHASWFHYPFNHHAWEREYRALTAVVSPHAQQDHLVVAFLSEKIAPRAPVIMPHHPSRSLWNKIRAACSNP